MIPQLPHRLLVVGAAAIETSELVQLIADLPADLPSPVVVAIHSLSRSQSATAMRLLTEQAKLRCAFASDGEPIESGRVYVAPPERHLIVERERLRVVFGPTENRHRPALDPLFRTAAQAYGASAIGVLLCGLAGEMSDGLFGLYHLGERGGIVVVPRRPGDSEPEGLNHASLFQRITVHHAPTRAELPPLLTRLATNVEGVTS